MFPRNQDIRQNGDKRTFYNGEKVAINDGYFTNGIYEGSIKNTEGFIKTHMITSIRHNQEYYSRWVDAYNVGKIIVSPTILKHVYLAKLGDPYLTNWVSNNGY